MKFIQIYIFQTLTFWLDLTNKNQGPPHTDEQYSLYCIEIQYQHSEFYQYWSYLPKIAIPIREQYLIKCRDYLRIKELNDLGQ